MGGSPEKQCEPRVIAVGVATFCSAQTLHLALTHRSREKKGRHIALEVGSYARVRLISRKIELQTKGGGVKNSSFVVVGIVFFAVALVLEFGAPGDGVTWAVLGVGMLMLSPVEWRAIFAKRNSR